MKTLTINIKSEDLDFFIKNKITIISPIENSDFQVVGALFSPFGQKNSVDFYESYFEYVSSLDTIAEKKVIDPNIILDVAMGKVYAFTGNVIKSTNRKCPEEKIGLENIRSGSNSDVVCGYGESISINNNSKNFIKEIFSLPFNSTVYFENTNVIYIFFSQGLSENMIIRNNYLNPNNSKNYESFIQETLIGNYLEINMNESKEVCFDSKSNQFIEI